MTHLERARACVDAHEAQFGIICPVERGSLVQNIATLLAQVTNEAYERAAEESERHSDAQFAMIEKNPSEASFHNFAGSILETNAALIRSLKVSP